MQCIAMHANNNTNNSRKENYSQSNFLFYNNNKNTKEGRRCALFGERPALPEGMNNEQLTMNDE